MLLRILRIGRRPIFEEEGQHVHSSVPVESRHKHTEPEGAASHVQHQASASEPSPSSGNSSEAPCDSSHGLRLQSAPYTTGGFTYI